MVSITIYLMGLGAIVSLIYAFYNFQKGTKMEHGTPVMQDIADAIREGADAFLKREFAISTPIIIGIAVLFGVIFTPWAGLAFLLGATMSAFAGLVGMKAAVIYNERVANEARLGVERKDPSTLGKALNIAFRGGSVMGLSVGGFAMLGLLVLYLIVGIMLQYSDLEKSCRSDQLVGLKFVVFPRSWHVILCCSSIAVFNRLGGGIYTKGADMGADLVGKLNWDYRRTIHETQRL